MTIKHLHFCDYCLRQIGEDSLNTYVIHEIDFNIQGIGFDICSFCEHEIIENYIKCNIDKFKDKKEKILSKEYR
jgi:hypothetical protein